VVDFVLVGSLLTLLFLGVLQVALDVHIRNVLAACAAEGARYGANADVGNSEAAAERTNELLRHALGPAYARARPLGAEGPPGLPLIGVRVTARLPLVAWFLPVGPSVTVSGHAVEEPPS
jgi:hypothetical protein